MLEPSEDDWKEIAERFYACWNFPNCIGALDGKHIVIQSPSRSGSLCYNYKGTFSIVLMALVDADYKFTFIDIWTMGVMQMAPFSGTLPLDKHS